jgi:NitT/TauT family transport system substrate-binding protein
MGIRFVANSVVTTRKMLEERPEVVKKFTRALLQGWQEILKPANEKKAIETVLKYNKETPEEIVRQQLPATRILMMPTPDSEFGKIDPAAWRQTEEIMLSQKLIPVPVYVEKLLKPIGKK